MFLCNRYQDETCLILMVFLSTHQSSLADNQIDSKGAESLAEALKSNTTLIQLNLYGE
jgi:hypothetical protein